MNRRYLLESTLTGQISEYDDPTEMRAVQALVQVCSIHLDRGVDRCASLKMADATLSP